MSILGMVLGIAAFFACLHWVDRASSRAKRIAKRSRDANSGVDIRIPVAYIADDLFPLITPYAAEGVSIKIVGEDGSYAHSKNGKELISGLRECLSLGAEIEYHLIDPTPDSLAKLSGLKAEFGKKFRPFKVNFERCSKSEDLQKIVEKFRYVHPTLVVDHNNAENRAMWIEYYHPRESDYAYDVVFTSCKAMTPSKITEFDGYNEALSLLSMRCCDELDHGAMLASKHSESMKAA